MYMQDKMVKKNERIHGWGAVAKRRIDYVYSVLRKDCLYDFKQQVLKEYRNCQKQRHYENPVELRKISQEVSQKNRFIISRIAVSVTNQCSLRCRDCNNLMPHCKERFTISVEEQIRDIEKLLYYVDGIINVEVIGGEPFVYKQLPILLRYLCNESKIKFIEITSNGTIMPSEEIMSLLKNSKVCVLLSDYGRVNAEKVKKTCQYLRQNNVRVQNLKNRKWIQSGGIEKRRKSKIRMKYEYFHCQARKDCRTLYKGRLYVCGRAPILDELGFLTENSSFFDIRRMNVSRTIGKEQLRKFFYNDYAECCDYCDYSSDFSYWIESGIQR